MPKLIIDNREIEVPSGTKVIEAAERLGITIPRFCFHPALGAVGACRVCAVAFKDGPVKGLQMSCMIKAQDGMVVSTQDPEAVDFRRHVIEWLMLHHPHDCPVCDEGGHCLLQDLTVSGGHGRRRYQGLKRTHRNQDLGPLVQHEMNRCIQCYRCSRYYQEYTGYRDLGVMGIGSRVYFGRAQSGVLESPFAGNLVDLCPTGVYTDKPSRYKGRRWDFQRAPSVCVHCGLGCNLVAMARYRQVVRVEARVNTEVNGHFICDRGRYGYAYAVAADRPRLPLVDGSPGEMPAAVAEARRRIEQAVNQFGPSCMAVAVSAGSSLETIAVGQYLCRQNNWTGPVVAQTARQELNMKSAVQHLKPELAVSLGAVSVADEVVVLGADPLNEAPMLALSLRQAWRQGAHVTVIDPRGVRLPFDVDHWAVHPSALDTVVRELVERIGTGALPDMPGASSPWPVSALADRLVRSRRTVVVCGTDIVTPQAIAAAGDLTDALRHKGTEAKLFFTMAEANAFAAGLTSGQCGSMEHLLDLIEVGRIRVLVVVEDDPWRRYPDRRRLEAALQRLDHLIVLGHVATALNHYAGCFLSTQTLYESGGCWINQEGRLQIARPVMAGGESIEISGRGDHPPRVFENRIPGGEPQAAWQIMLALGRRSDSAAADDDAMQLKAALTNFHPAVAATYHTPEQRIALDAVARAHQNDLTSGSSGYPPSEDDITVLLVDWTFGTTAPADMSPALNAIAPSPVARLHPQDMARLHLDEEQQIALQIGSGHFTLPVMADARMAPGVMVIPRHRLLDWQLLGQTRFSLERGRIHAADATFAP